MTPPLFQVSEHVSGVTAGRSKRERALHLPSTPTQTLQRLHPQPRRRQQGGELPSFIKTFIHQDRLFHLHLRKMIYK